LSLVLPLSSCRTSCLQAHRFSLLHQNGRLGLTLLLGGEGWNIGLQESHVGKLQQFLLLILTQKDNKVRVHLPSSLKTDLASRYQSHVLFSDFATSPL